MDKSANCTVVIEILQREATVADCAAAKYYFDDLAILNDGVCTYILFAYIS